MNKIEKLIEELCPQGVEFRSFQDLLDHKIIYTVSPPKKLTKKHYKSSGEFPIIDQGQSFIVGYTNNRNLIVDDGEYVVFGDHTEAIKYVDFPFAQGADGIKILKTKGLLAKYLYYALNNFYTKTGKYTRHFSFLKKIQIPIPPLAIQKEIVKILDNFTRLEAELEAELEARKKQYEHYREELLTFGDDVEWKALGEVCDVTSGGTPSKSKIEFWTGGTIPWLKSESCNNEPVYQANHFITDLGLLKSSAKLINKNATLMALVGATIFKTAYLEFDSTTNQNIASVKSKDNFILEDKFTFYYLTNLYGELKNKMKDYGMLNLTTLRKFQIPIPPLSKQKEIVAILDKFDALVNDISTGLPAEIEARRKQYEYYRNQLLTFKPLELQDAN